MTMQEQLPPFSVAVIGMAGRFPGAPDIDAFWQNLFKGESGGRVMSGVPKDKDLVNYGFPLDNIERFDAAFFEMSPREAALTDPQHRIFLECAFSALEHAGIAAGEKDASIGIFASCNFNTYLFNVSRGISMTRPSEFFDVVIGNDKDYLVSRVAYKLNLKGPAIAVQTACSSSLTAVTVACQSLLSGQCDVALTGGVGIRADQQSGYHSEQDGALSADGIIRSFSDDATGVNEGNGVGIVVLKRLEDAVQDNDTIYAVIRGYAVNNDGAEKAGFSAPSVSGQAAAIAEALAMADVSSESIGYIETHGTGTPIGDPIEFEALKQAWSGRDPQAPRCLMGAVKTGIGHLNAAAGIAGFIKTVLALHHQTIPASLNFHAANPRLDLVHSPFEIATDTRYWAVDQHPRRAAVSAFGLGGVNVHVILEEAPLLKTTAAHPESRQILPLSARTETALLARADQLAGFLDSHPECDLEAVAQTLALGRRAMEYRTSITASTPSEAATALRSGTLKKNMRHLKDVGKKQKVAFLFPGAGSQHYRMGVGLYQSIPRFSTYFDQCADVLRSQKNLDLLTVLTDEQALNQPVPGMCAIFAIEYALGRTLLDWGITPDALIGHSLGEYAAATLSGVFSLETATHLVWSRARLIDRTADGAMLFVPLTETDVTPYLGKDISIAAMTSPDSCVLSGADTAMTALMSRFDAEKIAYSKVAAGKAGHSPLLDPVLAEFRNIVSSTMLNPPCIPIISNVSGTWLTAEEATDPDYWVNQLRQPVRLSDGLTVLSENDTQIFLEVGPGRRLSALVRKHPALRAEKEKSVIPTLPAGESNTHDLDCLLDSVTRLWAAGGPINWQSACFAESPRKTLALPTYPFEGGNHWISQPAAPDSLVNDEENSWLYVPVWQEIPSVSTEKPDENVTLLLTDDDALATTLSDRLEHHGWTAQHVKTPENLRSWLGKGGCTVIDCRYLSPLTTHPTRLPAVCQQFYDTPVALGALLAECSQNKPLQVIFAARGMTQVFGTEPCDPLRAMLLGPCRVLPFEAPGVTALTIDIASEASDNEIATTLINLLGNKHSNDAPLSLVASRNGRLWTQNVTRLASKEEASFLPLRNHGVYLVPGGSGGIGLTLMGELAAQAKEQHLQIVLIPLQRTLPEESHWQNLRDQGAEVIAVAADLGDFAQMQTVIRKCEAEYGPVAGIIHAAGVSGGGLMQAGPPTGTASNFSAKVKGLICLDTLFAERDFDFVVLCSSLGVFSGTIGQVDNTAANAVLDAWARNNALAKGCRIVSINWDVWQEVGMINALGERHHRITGKAMTGGLTPDQAKQMFRQAVALNLPQVAVSTHPLSAMLADIRARRGTATHVFEQVNLNSTISSERPDLVVPYRAPRNDLDHCIRTIFEERLGIKGIGIDDDYIELGGDSLLAMPLTAEIRDTFRTPFAVAVLFQTRTIAKISDYLAAQADGPTRIVPLASMLRQIRQMTPEQVTAELRHGNTTGSTIDLQEAVS